MSMSHCLSTYIDLFYLDSNAVNLRDGFHRFKKKNELTVLGVLAQQAHGSLLTKVLAPGVHDGPVLLLQLLVLQKDG